ncbi:MAG: amidase [Microcystaceae cyanobacterium]
MLDDANAGIDANWTQTSSSLVFKSAVELTELLRKRSLSSVDLVQAYLDHITTHNPALNAVITLDAERAHLRAKSADEALAKGDCWGPLHGLPMTIKDALATAGLRTTFGDPTLASYVPNHDAAVVRAVKQAGAIVLGKTNIPWKSYDWQCQHPTAGRANNPWDLGRTPGGSSGGAAAALAAGFTPLELGSDAAGSIRLPAHFCGVCGLRPTEGSLSDTGHMTIPGLPHSMRHIAVVGPLARNLPDLQLLLSVLRQAEVTHNTQWAIAPVGSQSTDKIELPRLKLAWTAQLGDIPVDGETQQILATFVQHLEAAGCQIEPVDLPQMLPGTTWEELLELWGLLQGAEMIPLLPASIRNTPLRYVLPQLYWSRLMGRSRLATAIAKGTHFGVDDYLRLLEKRDRLIHQLDQWLSQWDGWLCPVTPTAAIAHQKPGSTLLIGHQRYPYADVFGLYLATTAILATPAVTFPIGQTTTGLPLGIQLHGRRWQDERVLAIAQALSAITNPLPTLPKLVITD